ncbi:MAG: hypothetical protein V4736_11160 [Bdellovibrionota bacterium]
MNPSFHLQRPLPLDVSTLQGFLFSGPGSTVQETWKWSIGIEGPVDPESGMILNLVHVQRIMEDAENHWKNPKVLTLFSTIDEKFHFLKEALKPFPTVKIKTICLEDAEGKWTWNFHADSASCELGYRTLAMWMSDTGIASRHFMRWSWIFPLKHAGLELWESLFAYLAKVPAWNEKSVDAFLQNAYSEEVTIEGLTENVVWKKSWS